MSSGVVCVSREERTQKAGARLCITLGGRGSPEVGVCTCNAHTGRTTCVCSCEASGNRLLPRLGSQLVPRMVPLEPGTAGHPSWTRDGSAALGLGIMDTGSTRRRLICHRLAPSLPKPLRLLTLKWE